MSEAVTIQCGGFKKTTGHLQRMLEMTNMSWLDKYGKRGVDALKRYTPTETGETANSWYYKIEHENGLDSIIWCNSHVEKGCNIAVILQYGHATKGGGWVEGQDYINPALRPIFEEIAREAWKEVKDR